MAGRGIQRRKSSSAAIYIPVAVLIIVFIWIFGTSVFFRVTAVEVSGLLRYTQEEVIEAAGISQGDNLLLIDENAAVIKLRAALPYVEEIKIRRSFPDTIVIELVESSEVAAVESQGAYWVIDSTGRILEKEYLLSRGLVHILGINPVEPAVGERIKVTQDTQTRLECMIAVLNAVGEAGLTSGVSKLDVSNISSITLMYLDKFNVTLGSADDLQGKLGKMTEVVGRLLESGSEGGSVLLWGDEPRFIPDN